MSSPDKPPIWARAEPRGRGPRGTLSRAEIAKAAIAIADAEGLEAVSIRRLARELGSGAMSLYHYFDNRDELLELMDDTVAAEMLVPSLPADWRAALEAIARHTRDTMLRHRWLLQGPSPVTPNLLRHIEQSTQAVAALAETGVDPGLLGAIVLAVDDYTLGHAFRELERDRRPEGRFEDPNVRYLLESGEFPLLARFAASGARPPASDFEQGLAWLLDGFAARITR